MLAFLLSFWVVFSKKMDSINSTIINMLSISALLSAVIFPSAQSCSKSVFNRLTSVLTEVLSKLAIMMKRICLEYPYHIIAFFGLLKALLAYGNRFFGVWMVQLRIRADSAFVMNYPDRFYADVRKDIFLAKKKLSSVFLFIYQGASSYQKRTLPLISNPVSQSLVRQIVFQQNLL